MEKSIPHFVRLALVCAALCCGFLPVAKAAERKAPVLAPVPPPAQPLAVKVKRGETVEIPLRIYGRKNEDLKYLIRAEPRHGKVTPPRVVEREVSVVIYTPPADLAITRDRFAYAVQNIDGVSAAVDVVITITDDPPDLALPGAMEFASMLVGETAAKSLAVSNRGGGLAEGHVAVEAPWKIEGSPKYRIAAGQRAVFKVVFAPDSGGEFESAVRFSSQPETSVPVRGSALAALAATPAKVTLQSAVGDPVRTGSFELSNQTDAERRATLHGGARLQVPADIVVPAKGKVTVTMQTAANDVAVLTGEVRVESSGLVLRVPVQAQRVGGIVRAAQPMVAFGRVDAAKPAAATFELENIGGAPASVSWGISAPFATDEASTLLAPGEKKALPIRTQPAAAGKYRGWLAVKSEQQTLEIPVEAELVGKIVAAAAAKSGASAVESAPAEPEAPAPVRATTITLPAATAEMQVNLIRPEGVKITHLEATGMTMEWPARLSVAQQFRFERRRVYADAVGDLKVRWEVLPTVSVQRAGDHHVAVFKALQPGNSYGVRVMPVGAGAEGDKPVFTQYFLTPAKNSVLPKITLLRVMFAALLVIVVLMLRQRRA